MWPNWNACQTSSFTPSLDFLWWELELESKDEQEEWYNLEPTEVPTVIPTKFMLSKMVLGGYEQQEWSHAASHLPIESQSQYHCLYQGAEHNQNLNEVSQEMSYILAVAVFCSHPHSTCDPNMLVKYFHNHVSLNMWPLSLDLNSLVSLREKPTNSPTKPRTCWSL